MSPEEIKKLLGGYATGTLTAEEQQALFAAALEDQELFDTLAREQALRDLLSDPASRAHLLAALDTPARRTFHFWEWLRRPAVAGLAVAGIGGIAVLAVWQGMHTPTVKPAPQIIAELKVQPAPVQSTAEVPAPSFQQEADKKVNAPAGPAADPAACREPAAARGAASCRYPSRGAAQSRIPCRRRGGQGSPSASGGARLDGAQGRSPSGRGRTVRRRTIRSHWKRHTRRAGAFLWQPACAGRQCVRPFGWRRRAGRGRYGPSFRGQNASRIPPRRAHQHSARQPAKPISPPCWIPAKPCA